MPGDSKDNIRKIIIPALPRFYHFFLFLWIGTKTPSLYYKLNTRRLGLTPIPKVVMTKTFYFPAHACCFNLLKILFLAISQFVLLLLPAKVAKQDPFF